MDTQDPHGPKGREKPKSRLSMMKNRLRQQRQKKDADAAAAGDSSDNQPEPSPVWEKALVNGDHKPKSANNGQGVGLMFGKSRGMTRSKTDEVKLSAGEAMAPNDASQKKSRSGLFKSKSMEMKLKSGSTNFKKSPEHHPKSPSGNSAENTYNVPNGRIEKIPHAGPLRIPQQRKAPEVKVASTMEPKKAPDSRIAKAPIMRMIPSRGQESRLARPSGVRSPTDNVPGSGIRIHRAYRPEKSESKDSIHSVRRPQQLQPPLPSRSISPPSEQSKLPRENVPNRTRPTPKHHSSNCDQEYSTSPRTDEALLVPSKAEDNGPGSPVGYSVGWVRRTEPVRSSSMEPDPHRRPMSKEEYKQRRQSRSLDNLVQESEELRQLTEFAAVDQRRPSVESQGSTSSRSRQPAQQQQKQHKQQQKQQPKTKKVSESISAVLKRPPNDDAVYGVTGLEGAPKRGPPQSRMNRLAQIPEADHTDHQLPGNSGKGSNGRPTGLRVTDPSDLKLTPGGVTNGHPPVVMRKQQATPRRHTVNVGGSVDYEMGSLRKDQEFRKQKAAFLDHLAEKYPEHAQVITGQNASESAKTHPAGEVTRRKTTQVTYNPDQNQSFVYDSDDVMSVQSEANTSPTGQFRRGGRMRASLPVVRSPNKSMDKPMGLVFLILRNETKRALLPNEITSIDTVRALFVRSFPEQLSMPWFEAPGRKIYIMDPATNVYYELEDLREIKNRTVLKIYDKEGGDSPALSPNPMTAPRPVSYQPPLPGYESDSSTRSAPPAPVSSKGSVPRSPVHRTMPHRPYSQDVTVGNKAQSLPVQPNYVYQQQMQQYGSQPHAGYSSHPNTPPSQHWSPGHRPHPHPNFGSNQSSPQRSVPAQPVGTQRHSVAYLPEQARAGYQPNGGVPQSRSYQDYPTSGSSRSGSATPTQDDMGSRSRIDKMEEQIASLTALMQTAVTGGGSRPGSARSNSSSIVSDASYSAKSSMSDISSTTPQGMVSVEMASSLRRLQLQAHELRSDCNKLRRLQQGNADMMRDTIQETFQKIRDAVHQVPGANDLPIRTERMHISHMTRSYKDNASKVDKDLGDLESSVEELRADVLNKRCRVNMAEVETMALTLSTVSKALADLKVRFPALQDGLKSVMSGEMEIVVHEEKFLKDEPDRIETALKRCKKLTHTLYTMKRLASVQEQRPHAVPNLQPNQDMLDTDRRQLLQNIEAMVPNHEARVQSLQMADVQRERKKKLATSSDALRFEKTLELAQKQLKETNNMQENEERAEKVLSTLFQADGKAANPPKAATPDRPAVRDSPDGSKVIECVQERKEVETLSSSPPQKPPRTMLIDTGSYSTEAVIVKSPVLVAPNTVASSPTLQPASPKFVGGSSRIPSMASRPPVPLPTATSTPKPGSGSHVTFSTTITEIKGASADTNGKPKKVPPPPPPRKSSRATVKKHSSPTSPVSGPQLVSTTRAESPHTYQNINDFGEKTQPAVEAKTTAAKSVPNGAKTGPATASKAGRPMSKFQKDIAEGIYANLNRPDLQEQKVNCAAVVRDANLSDKDRSSDESENSSMDSQKNATVKRKVNGENGAKKVPPPPPVRKTSALSSSNNGEVKKELPRFNQLQAPKQRLPEPKKTGSNKPLSNGDIAGHSPVNGSAKVTTSTVTSTTKTGKKFEETEIY